jgi:hypothetical protein
MRADSGFAALVPIDRGQKQGRVRTTYTVERVSMTS